MQGSYCSVFQWVDPPMCRRAKKIIPGLLTKLGEKDRQLNELRLKVCANTSNERRLMTYRLLGVAFAVTTVVLGILYGKAMMSCM
ncbi:UNVERIFIED_CONTAM: hypothetical protein Sradi_0215400 [Sesamum radiatum]|uniref:Uncharacterized protein n=1 Tax=Sesamum radiatum TaxID=300843 RepID=A0AAW2W4L8_SESRA